MRPSNKRQLVSPGKQKQVVKQVPDNFSWSGDKPVCGAAGEIRMEGDGAETRKSLVWSG